MIDTGVITYSVSAGAFLGLSVLIVTLWRRREWARWLIVACVVSLLWSIVLAHYALSRGETTSPAVEVLEILRAIAWFLFLLSLLRIPLRSESADTGPVRLIRLVAVALPITVFGLTVVRLSGVDQFLSLPLTEAINLGNLLVAIFGLVLIEQLFRNAPSDQRWGIKFLCFGVGGVFAFDFYMYADTLLLKRIDVDLWNARGAVNALAVPLIAISGIRVPQWSKRVYVSRHVVFHGAALLGAGTYLMVMAAAGYYIRAHGGEWGTLFQVIFFFGALTVLLVLALSGQIRARLKVLIVKHFFRSKYDYRKEWLRFVDVLSDKDPREDVRLQLLKAIAEIVESPNGTMWAKMGNENFFVPTAAWNVTVPNRMREPLTSAMIGFIEKRQWVIDIKEYAEQPEIYNGIELPDWLGALPEPRLVLPLLHHGDLEAFVVLGEPRANMILNWEDRDLLKTVGRQAASYLRLVATTEALFQAQQFQAFNRLSAYVVHDLKNLAAQLSLIVTNAKKHMHNPEFIEDSIQTVEYSVVKMNRMLAQLRKDRAVPSGHDEVVDLANIVRNVVAERSSTPPVPEFGYTGGAIATVSEPDRLAAVLGHVIQNAQEATTDDGTVEVRLFGDDGWAIIEVEDTGAGMDEEFVRTRLFRPFDTTKGNAGMGIGAYECREFVRSHGGEVEVVSQPGKGTTFRIRLKRHQSGNEDGTPLSAAS